MLPLALVAFVSLGVVTRAQTTWIAPASAASSDANSAFVAPGSTDVRMQIVIDAEHLIANSVIRQIAFRRDAGFDADYLGGEANVRIEMSHAARGAAQASNVFAHNHDATGSTTVFDGLIELPGSPTPSGRAVTWSAVEDRIAFVLSTPFAYVGGPLCIDLVSRRVVGAESGAWSIDAIADSARGTVAQAGESCSPQAALTQDGRRSSLRIHPLELVPGGTASIVGYGSPGEASVMMLGFQSSRIDLSLLGLAPAGCELRVQPVASLASTFVSDAPLPGGVARFALEFPADASVLGAQFMVQMAEFTIPLYTSEMLDCVISSHAASLGMSLLFAPLDPAGTLPVRGRAWKHRAPVVAFTVD